MRSRHSLLFSEVAPHFPSERLEKAGIWSRKLTAKRERGLDNSWPRPSGELHRGSDQRRTGRRAAASGLHSMRGKRQREAPGRWSLPRFGISLWGAHAEREKKQEWLWKLRDYVWKDGAKGKDRESRVPVFQYIGSSRSLMSFVKKNKKPTRAFEVRGAMSFAKFLPGDGVTLWDRWWNWWRLLLIASV